MKIRSTNIAQPKTIHYRGREIETGIFKEPKGEGILLLKEGVDGDTVSDRRVHGGEDKACYLYPFEHYNYWKPFFPDLDWQMGMFGENLTIEGLLELNAKIGAEYQIGETVVQVTQPRQPCFKLGLRFNDLGMVKQFAQSPYPGIYVRVLKEGLVRPGDTITLLRETPDTVSVLDVFCLLMGQFKNDELYQKAIVNESLAKRAKADLEKIKK